MGTEAARVDQARLVKACLELGVEECSALGEAGRVEAIWELVGVAGRVLETAGLVLEAEEGLARGTSGWATASWELAGEAELAQEMAAVELAQVGMLATAGPLAIVQAAKVAI